jgi:protein SCO1/2
VTAVFLALFLVAPDARRATGPLAGGQSTPAGHGHHSTGATPDRVAPAGDLVDIVLPDVTLVDMDAQPVSLRRELTPDVPVMLNFIFTTCPTICPVMSATFAEVRSNLGAEAATVRMVSISIDPEHDTPPRLREYASRYEAGREWRFLTGDRATIETVLKAFGAYRGNKMNHAPLTFLRASRTSPWLRLEKLRSAADLLQQYRRLHPADR